MTKKYGTGGGDAYYDAVHFGGYEGSREQFGKDQADFARNAQVALQSIESADAAQMFTSAHSTCAVERVDGGTRLLAKISARKLCAQLGYYYNAESDTLRVYSAYSLIGLREVANRKFYLLGKYLAGETSVELTTENAETVLDVNVDNAGSFTHRTNFTQFAAAKAPMDLRFCAIGFDANNKEVERVYSAQYRYTVADGVVSRGRIQTAPTQADHIVDVGLRRNTLAASEKLSIYQPSTRAILPLVNTDEPAAYRFVLPDSFFENAPYGLSCSVMTGDGWTCDGPTVYKATVNVSDLLQRIEALERTLGGE